MAKVFLTGGGGYIGGELADALIERGDEVVALAHSDASARTLAQKDVKVVRGDVLDRQCLQRALASCELAYHVAGVNSHCPKDPRYLLAVNVEGPANVVFAAAQADVSRVIITSSAASIGERAGTVGTENSPHRGSYLSLYDKSKHDGERAAFAAATKTGVHTVALNPSSVQGPPRKGGNGAIIIAYLNGKLKAFVDTHVSIVDVQDVVAAQLLAASRGDSLQRYILNGETVRSAQALALVSELAGIEQKVWMLPPQLVRGAAILLDCAMRACGKTSPICRGRIDTILHGHQYDGSKATRELGLRYTPLRETFRRTIDWAVAEGLVTRPLARGTQQR